ncbi:MAG: DUF1810 domain-containing protein [Gemmatimonadota bacterium]
MPDQPAEDPFNLRRFVSAQDADQTFERALAEIRRGAKTTHWMWYVFPQLVGLGGTGKAQKFGISDRAEAEAYLAHPILGPRLVQCAEAALGVDGKTAVQIFDEVDAKKLRSSATLFATVSPPGSVFHQLLAKYYDDVPDGTSVARLGIAD